MRHKDLVRAPRLGSVAPHSSGAGAVFTATHYHKDTNTVHTKLSMASFKEFDVKELGEDMGSEPFWFSETQLGVVREVNGTNQVLHLYYILFNS